MPGGSDRTWANFFSERTRPLSQRFSGMWRAVVVETNDPLNMRRIRFKVPELHDWDLEPDMCPWAVPAPDMGTKGCGRFVAPSIGDFVWIEFEKNHPYGPVYTGFADPTRRKFYPLSSVHGVTPLPVDSDGEIDDQPSDYDENYLPKDGRPMSHGWQDRYGHLDIHNSVGFFPIEHESSPPTDTDPLTGADFQGRFSNPESNNPDSKMMMRLSKYGMLILQADMGYDWKSEFSGDFDLDNEFEINRWLYTQKLIHEDKATGHDQRRLLHLTRYGHKLELRDVGWNRSRAGEWTDNARDIGNGEDQRWIKLRTKGGQLIQLSDVGNDAEGDNYVSRLLLEEASDQYLDHEDEFNGDARFIRFVTRSGIKLALDDRTSHESSAEDASLANKDIGIGFIVKGRATPGTKADGYAEKSGSPKGYFFQFDERPDRNSTSWGTPLGQLIEMDDNEEFLVICSRLPDIVADWKNLSGNEFMEDSAEGESPWNNCHHLVIDHGRDAIRLKSRAGSGESSVNKKMGESASGEHAGLEIHDAPEDDPWTELVDIDDRGLWFSRKDNVGVWRGRDGTDISIWIDDGNNNVVIRNASAGKVQIFCDGNVELVSNSLISMQSNRIDMNANEIRMNAAGTNYTFQPGSMRTNGDIHAGNVFAHFPTAERPVFIAGTGIGRASGGGTPPSNVIVEEPPNRTKPDNRLT